MRPPCSSAGVQSLPLNIDILFSDAEHPTLVALHSRLPHQERTLGGRSCPATCRSSQRFRTMRHFGMRYATTLQPCRTSACPRTTAASAPRPRAPQRLRVRWLPQTTNDWRALFATGSLRSCRGCAESSTQTSWKRDAACCRLPTATCRVWCAPRSVNVKACQLCPAAELY